MIKAILPVPNRIYRPGALYIGEGVDQCWDPMGQVCDWRWGRNIRIPPLTFYKVYSEWKGYLISHTFITDQSINPRDLQINRNLYTGEVQRTSPVLVPISVTYGKPGCITETYLFTKSIDFLLSNYVIGRSISMCSAINFPAARPIYPDTPDRIPVGLYRGLSGIVEYLDTLLQIVVHTEMDKDFNRWCPNNIAYTIRQWVTPERPSCVINLLKDMVYYEKNNEGLFDLVDNLIGLNSKEDPRCLIDEFLFRGQYDPVTVLCLNTPSYITADALLPYLEDQDLACGYFDMACSDVYLSESFNGSCLMDKMSSFHELMFEDLMEFFYQVPHTDVTIHMDLGDDTPQIITHDRFGIFQMNDMIYSELTSKLHTIFLYWKTAIRQFDEITLSKTWLGELLITGTKGTYTERYYVNLNLYHLISPSLVNRERLESIIGVNYTL